MEKALLILAAVISIMGNAQPNYEQGMQQAFSLWEEGKNDEASALFERISSAEKDNWLPGYYVALVNTTTAFSKKDTKEVSNLLNKAQTALDNVLDHYEDNAELMVMQAMIHTAWLAHDPMTHAQKLSPEIMKLYAMAEKLEPENPRVVSSKAQFELGGAQYFGSDTTAICKQLEKSLQLFDTFKPETPFHPNWGKEYTEQVLKGCKM